MLLSRKHLCVCVCVWGGEGGRGVSPETDEVHYTALRIWFTFLSSSVGHTDYRWSCFVSRLCGAVQLVQLVQLVQCTSQSTGAAVAR